MTGVGAVILAGGAGRRLGGVDKPGLVVGGRTLLDTAIAACSDCAEVVVVGSRRPTERKVRWTVEEPPAGGPVAGLAAGLQVLPGHITDVVVLAADLPSVTPQVVTALREAFRGSASDAVLLTDDDGRIQPLLAIYARAALDEAFRAVGDPHGRAFRYLIPQLRIATLEHRRAASDIDTPADLARWTMQSRERKDDQ